MAEGISDVSSSEVGTNVDIPTEQPRSPLPSTSYSCTSCQIAFQNGQEQRVHMKQPWHVFNIKRRVAELPPITRDAFDAQVEDQTETSKVKATGSKRIGVRVSNSSDEEEVSYNEDEETASPFQCLFCSLDFATDDTGLATNLEHMRTVHGMFIPDPETVVDMQSFVGYLATEVREWHECLYCGATKPSTESIQSHMRDKGHCLLNLDREPELLDFWEDEPEADEEHAAAQEQERPANLSTTEILFASGKVIESRHAAAATKKASRKQRALAASETKVLPPGSGDAGSALLPEVNPQQATSRQLARRDEMSIIGISTQQRQALVLAEKKAQRSEAVARRAREWAYNSAANTQKFDQIDGKNKWGKQNHKLQPR
ncbi:hypothetical protein H2200_007572 [Cladophialophora chaetospira]|uniref:C2H2-type domain-containing protein n=1 Tax=Cladophialophora chaetospira TaxID=386627 RepID=A0AA38X632_9EURO|nr:hypothetical protein H2200_007572 [Cladophialophora chaetospira]